MALKGVSIAEMFFFFFFLLVLCQRTLEQRPVDSVLTHDDPAWGRTLGSGSMMRAVRGLMMFI